MKKSLAVVFICTFTFVGCASSHINVSTNVPTGKNISIKIETTDKID
jgi:hypothetical protein|tara:strand:- start:2375 stop:2515 length:141 start_codon:yes stop_codon:yes gene_type:complete